MNPKEISQLMDLIHFIRDNFKLTVLLIEHQMRLVMGICERLAVLDFGAPIAAGTPANAVRTAASSRWRAPCLLDGLVSSQLASAAGGAHFARSVLPAQTRR